MRFSTSSRVCDSTAVKAESVRMSSTVSRMGGILSLNWSQDSNTVVEPVGDQYAPKRIHGQAIGKVELGVSGKTPIAFRSRDAGAGNGVDGSVGPQAADHASESGRSS